MLRSSIKLARRVLAARRVRVVWFSPQGIEVVVLSRANSEWVPEAVERTEGSGDWLTADAESLAKQLHHSADGDETDTVILLSGAYADALVVPASGALRGWRAADEYFRWRMEKEVFRPSTTTAVCWQRLTGTAQEYLCTALATEIVSRATEVCERAGWVVDMTVSLPQLYGEMSLTPADGWIGPVLTMVVEPEHVLGYFANVAGKSFLRSYAGKSGGVPVAAIQAVADLRNAGADAVTIRVVDSGALARAIVDRLQGVGEQVDGINQECKVEDSRDLVAHACRAAGFLTGQD